MEELHAIFRGRVQGVGFRWTVEDAAREHALKGTVKNLSDGSVEVVAQGEKNELKNFLQRIKVDPGSARITSVSCSYREIINRFPDFRIIH
jgi:acylphosphatase